MYEYSTKKNCNARRKMEQNQNVQKKKKRNRNSNVTNCNKLIRPIILYIIVCRKIKIKRQTLNLICFDSIKVHAPRYIQNSVCVRSLHNMAIKLN